MLLCSFTVRASERSLRSSSYVVVHTYPNSRFGLFIDDLVHRGSARLVDKHGALWRPMHKWQFLRTTEPTSPTWNHNPETAPRFDPQDTMTPIYESVWSWLCGSAPPMPTMPAVKSAQFGYIHSDREAGDEPERLAAAHRLGQAAYHGNTEALDALGRGLTDSREAVRRSCVHGLAAAGDAATPIALAALESVEPRTIGLGADVLSECALQPTTEAVAAVAAALSHLAAVIDSACTQVADGAHGTERSGAGPIGPEWLAVQACVQCLGNLGQRCVPSSIFSGIAHALLPHLSSESDAVRRKAAEAAMPLCNCSIAKINTGCGEATSRALVEELRHCLLDTNRYVIASGAEGLMRLGPQGSSKSQSAKLAVLAKLVDKRWCPITNPASQF